MKIIQIECLQCLGKDPNCDDCGGWGVNDKIVHKHFCNSCQSIWYNCEDNCEHDGFMISEDRECWNCYYNREKREARNDSGV